MLSERHYQLSSYGFTDEPNPTGIGANRYAYAYLITENTPYLSGRPWPNPDKQADNCAWLTTTWVTFSLQVWSQAEASAFGLLHDRTSTHEMTRAEKKLHFAIYDESGSVVGAAEHVQLPGGLLLDADAIQHDLLTRESTLNDSVIDVVQVDLSELPISASYAIDLNTRRPVPVA